MLLKFDIEEEIPPTRDREYTFKFVNKVDNFKDVIIEEGSDDSEEDTPFHYSGVDDDFPTLNELFQSHNEDEVRRKVVEKIATEGVPESVSKEDLLEERKRWFKVTPKERKFKSPLQFFTDHPDKSLGDILSWGYFEDLKVYAIRREFRTKKIKQFYYGPEVKCRDQRLWNYIKLQAKDNFPDWKPHKPMQIVKTDPVTRDKYITLKIKQPRCLKNMPLRGMEQDFHEDFKGWLYNQSTAEAVITLFDVKTGDCRRIHILDSMWLVNCSKKDIECLFFNKIVYNEPDKV
ncbi:hypothetical protein Hanom_Chr15g01395471 [Helianthus anomalus]